MADSRSPYKWNFKEDNSSSRYARTLDYSYKPYSVSTSLSSSRTRENMSQASSKYSFERNYNPHLSLSKLKTPSRPFDLYSKRNKDPQISYSSMMEKSNYEYVMTNEKIDYKALFERERQEKEV